MKDRILALNAGSSSIKFALFTAAAGGALSRQVHGELEGIGAAPHFWARDQAGRMVAEQRWEHSGAVQYAMLVETLLSWIEAHLGPAKLAAAGHRVVHGGRAFTAPVRVDEEVLRRLAALTPLAPLHQPHSLELIRAMMAARPALPQVACFDTAFHHTMPAIATRFALPGTYAQEGVRRYGFHGLSYEYIAQYLRQKLPHLAEGRVIAAHLGNGASLCAMAQGRSVDSSMGFTALDGLMMGTRCGSIDPGVLLYLAQQKGMTPQAVEHLLYCESGLLGVSGLSSDMRLLLASDDPRAKEAVALFVFMIARHAGALAASLGGLDGFIFTAGIGEHAHAIQDAVCERLAWLGVAAGGRAAGRTRLSAAGSKVEVHVIPTDEDAMIGQHTARILGLAQAAAQ